MRWLLGVLAVGCGGGDVGVASAGDGSTGDLETTTVSPTAVSTSASSTLSTTDPDASTSVDASSSSDDSSSTGAPAECGNGIVEDGEECDGEACRSDCLLPCRGISVTQVDAGENQLLALADVQPGPDDTAIAVGTLGWQGGDVVTARVDADGNLLDLDLFDYSGETDAGVALSVADDGSRFVVVDTVNGPSVLRYDADGELLWTETQLEASAGAGATALPGGGVVVSGTANVGIPGHFEIWAARYGASGHLWSTTWASAPPEASSHPHGGPVAASPLGRIFVAGDQPSVSGTFGVYDPVVLAFGPEGGGLLWSWSESLQATNLDLLARDIVVDAEGRVAALFFLAHSTASSAHFQLRMFDPDGRPVRTFDSDALDHGGGEQAAALVADPEGRLIVFARRIGIGAGEASGRTLVLAFDSAGEIVCDETLEDDLGWIAAAALDDAGNILVAGTGYTSTSASYGTMGRVTGFQAPQ